MHIGGLIEPNACHRPNLRSIRALGFFQFSSKSPWRWAWEGLQVRLGPNDGPLNALLFLPHVIHGTGWSAVGADLLGVEACHAHWGAHRTQRLPPAKFEDDRRTSCFFNFSSRAAEGGLGRACKSGRVNRSILRMHCGLSRMSIVVWQLKQLCTIARAPCGAQLNSRVVLELTNTKS
jgi:hypothetical protein